MCKLAELYLKKKKINAIANDSIQSVYACREGDKNKAVMVWSPQTPGYVVL